jgi:hypothetical protein
VHALRLQDGAVGCSGGGLKLPEPPVLLLEVATPRLLTGVLPRRAVGWVPPRSLR